MDNIDDIEILNITESIEEIMKKALSSPFKDDLIELELDVLDIKQVDEESPLQVDFKVKDVKSSVNEVALHDVTSIENSSEKVTSNVTSQVIEEINNVNLDINSIEIIDFVELQKEVKDKKGYINSNDITIENLDFDSLEQNDVLSIVKVENDYIVPVEIAALLKGISKSGVYNAISRGWIKRVDGVSLRDLKEYQVSKKHKIAGMVSKLLKETSDEEA